MRIEFKDEAHFKVYWYEKDSYQEQTIQRHDSYCVIKCLLSVFLENLDLKLLIVLEKG